jgi:hypothetical protein
MVRTDRSVEYNDISGSKAKDWLMSVGCGVVVVDVYQDRITDRGARYIKRSSARLRGLFG